MSSFRLHAPPIFSRGRCGRPDTKDLQNFMASSTLFSLRNLRAVKCCHLWELKEVDRKRWIFLSFFLITRDSFFSLGPAKPRYVITRFHISGDAIWDYTRSYILCPHKNAMKPFATDHHPSCTWHSSAAPVLGVEGAANICKGSIS